MHESPWMDMTISSDCPSICARFTAAKPTQLNPTQQHQRSILHYSPAARGPQGGCQIICRILSEENIALLQSHLSSVQCSLPNQNMYDTTSYWQCHLSCKYLNWLRHSYQFYNEREAIPSSWNSNSVKAPCAYSPKTFYKTNDNHPAHTVKKNQLHKTTF